MRRILIIVFLFLLAACSAASPAAQPAGNSFEQTKFFPLTEEAETRTAASPKNDATLTALIAGKSAGATAMAATLRAIPTETPTPTIPPDSAFCTPADLSAKFIMSQGATAQIVLGAGLANISPAPCFLQAWPQVVLVDQNGKPLDVDYHYYDPSANDVSTAATEQARDATSAKVGLPPGWTAFLDLIWSNWCGGKVAGGSVIRLTLGNNAGVLDLPTDAAGGGRCEAPAYRSSVGISKIDFLEPSP